jgi:hypothetical protein
MNALSKHASCPHHQAVDTARLWHATLRGDRDAAAALDRIAQREADAVARTLADLTLLDPTVRGWERLCVHLGQIHRAEPSRLQELGAAFAEALAALALDLLTRELVQIITGEHDGALLFRVRGFWF